jgi:hypothetical protein
VQLPPDAVEAAIHQPRLSGVCLGSPVRPDPRLDSGIEHDQGRVDRFGVQISDVVGLRHPTAYPSLFGAIEKVTLDTTTAGLGSKHRHFRRSRPIAITRAGNPGEHNPADSAGFCVSARRYTHAS